MRSTTKKMTSSFGIGQKKTYTVKIAVYVFFCFMNHLQSLSPPCRHTLGSAFSSFIYAYFRRTLKFEVFFVSLRSVPGPTSTGCRGTLRSGRRITEGLRFTSVGAEPRSTGPCAPTGPRAFSPAGSVSPRTNVPRTL